MYEFFYQGSRSNILSNVYKKLVNSVSGHRISPFLEATSCSAMEIHEQDHFNWGWPHQVLTRNTL
jgi:hypothetical protein